jgi:hypothetical protein
MRFLGKVSKATKADFCGNVFDGEQSPNFHLKLRIDSGSSNPLLILDDQTGQYTVVTSCP